MIPRKSIKYYSRHFPTRSAITILPTIKHVYIYIYVFSADTIFGPALTAPSRVKTTPGGPLPSFEQNKKPGIYLLRVFSSGNNASSPGNTAGTHARGSFVRATRGATTTAAPHRPITHPPARPPTHLVHAELPDLGAERDPLPRVVPVQVRGDQRLGRPVNKNYLRVSGRGRGGRGDSGGAEGGHMPTDCCDFSLRE